ncbi:AMP-binding protein [Streptomyces sp. SID685]|uniref:AMP-binding protein n=1 Tax=Streptomyces sp. SID685 TaxID=2690322 RepID=UPI001926C771
MPTTYDLMTRQPGWAKADLSSPRLLTCGGAPVPTSLISLYQQRGLEFLQGYGMTEVGPAALWVAGEYSVTKAGPAVARSPGTTALASPRPCSWQEGHRPRHCPVIR